MKDEARNVLSKLKQSGTTLTFEGEFLADFIERLDKVIEVEMLKMDGDALKVIVGEPKQPQQEDVLKVVTKASLLNVSAAGYEDTPMGKMLYFEFYLPPWQRQYLE